MSLEPSDTFSSGLLAKQVAAHVVKKSSENIGIFTKPFELAINSHSFQLASDVLFTWSEGGGFNSKTPATIDGCEETEIEFLEDSGDFSHVTLTNCIFSRIYVDDDFNPKNLPKIENSIISTLQGAFRPSDYPSIFIDTNIDSLEGRGITNDSIMSLEIEEGARVLLTILKKVYMQKGASRQRSALSRGLDQRFRALVDPIIEICKQEELMSEIKRRGIDLVVSNPRQRKRVLDLLAKPQSVRDPALTKAKNL